MKPFNNWQMSGLILGGLDVIWAFAIEFSKSTIGVVLDEWGMGYIFFFLILGAGILCCAGSLMKCRKFRMWGLATTTFVMAPCGLFMLAWGIINVATLTMPWIAFMSLLVLLRDTTRKTRNEPVGN